MRIIIALLIATSLLSCRVQKNIQKSSSSLDSSYSINKESESTKVVKEAFETSFLFNGDSLEGVATPEPGEEVSFESGSQVVTIGRDSSGKSIRFKAVAKPRETSMKGNKETMESGSEKEVSEGTVVSEEKSFKKEKEVISYPWIGFAIAIGIAAILLFILYRRGVL